MQVFYNEAQATLAESGFSPSAGKPKDLVERWLSEKRPIEVVNDFKPASFEQLTRAHNRGHVRAVLEGRKQNGFRNRSLEIAETLQWTSGSMLAAAWAAIENKTVAMSPTSGFHHATHQQCMGFCTFNGLMVTAMDLLEWGSKKVGILDLDHHYGNGTDTIIDWLVSNGELAFDQIHHYSFGGDRNFNYEDGVWGGRTSYSWIGPEVSKGWLKKLPDIVRGFKGCDVVLFQAGADPFVDDPCHEMLGVNGALTREQLRERDRIVFETLNELNVPVAWNLAGGYQDPLSGVLDIHTATLEECLKVYE